ncbi:MAG: carbohydrate kinase family protein [Methanothermobacter sp.]|nr:carbohydrate kinase family protein [Methanothermobacter sp.]
MDIVSVGTANIDFILKVPSFVEPDTEMNIEKLHLSPGGSALNFAIHATRNGLKTGIVAKLGLDYFGDIIYNRLKDEGVDIKGLSRTSETTGMAFISVDRTGRRSIYSFMGANKELKIGKREIDYISKADLIHLGGTYLEIAFPAAEHANLLSFAPGALLAAYGISTLRPILQNTDVLFLNEHELKLLTGKSPKEGINLLIDEGIPLIVITRGSKGAEVHTKKDLVKYKVKEVKALDTTGAGDAFAAGFIASWTKGESLNSCLKKAHGCALKNLKKLGAI